MRSTIQYNERAKGSVMIGWGDYTETIEGPGAFFRIFRGDAVRRSFTEGGHILDVGLSNNPQS